MKFLLLFLALTIGFSNNLHADFARGLAAYEAGDYETAFKEWTSSAESGDLAAMRNVGHMFRWGKGIEKNPSRASYWYHRAAKAGFDKAQFNLAVLYLNGEGVPKDEKEAARWLELASKQGHKEAKEKLEEIKQNLVSAEQEKKEETIETKTINLETKKTEIIEEKVNKKPQAPQIDDEIKKTLFVHLSSYNNRETAVLGWKQFMKKLVGFERFDMEIKEADIKGKGKIFRLFAKGDDDDAINLCKTLKNKKEYCIVYDENNKAVF